MNFNPDVAKNGLLKCKNKCKYWKQKKTSLKEIFFICYLLIAFNFLAKLDFFLAAVFLTITPFVQA